MFRAHVLIIKRSKLYYTASGIITPIGVMISFSITFSLQPGHYSSLTTPNLQPRANQERNDQCGNQHYSRELLMMGIVVPEKCSAYKKYNKIISGI